MTSLLPRFRRALALASLTALSLSAASTPVDDGYAKIARERADKIVGSLNLAEAPRAERVRALIAAQYQELHDAHARRDQAVATAKQAGADKAALVAATTKANTVTEAAVAALHTAYLQHLGAELSPAQIEQVKDGMTYGVLPLTFRVYQEMFPQLTTAQRDQIRAWLVEAREHAMDAGTAKEKHAWFGKYKGRINNFLSAAGYDLKQAERELARRRPADQTP
jgi:hypothetical protein